MLGVEPQLQAHVRIGIGTEIAAAFVHIVVRNCRTRLRLDAAVALLRLQRLLGRRAVCASAGDATSAASTAVAKILFIMSSGLSL